MDRLNGMSLFSGIGGLDLALHEWVRPVLYCERDRYAQGVLMSRMRDGSLDRAPIWNDVTTLSRREAGTHVDIIHGGFPCQDISVAGRGVGLGGERSGLFFEIIRLAKETNAPFVFLENVPAIRTRGLRQVIGAFTGLGYNCRWTVVSAAEVGATHLRKRWFLLAHAGNQGAEGFDRSVQPPMCEKNIRRQASVSTVPGYSGENVADSESERSGQRTVENKRPQQQDNFMREDWWTVEPNVGRVANGVPFRVDRIRALGNAVVPLQAREAFERLLGL